MVDIMQRYCRDGERDDGISMMVFFGIPSKFHHRGVAASVPRRTCGDDGLLKNPRFPPFSGRLWMLLDEVKRTNNDQGKPANGTFQAVGPQRPPNLDTAHVLPNILWNMAS